MTSFYSQIGLKVSECSIFVDAYRKYDGPVDSMQRLEHAADRGAAWAGPMVTSV